MVDKTATTIGLLAALLLNDMNEEKSQGENLSSLEYDNKLKNMWKDMQTPISVGDVIHPRSVYHINKYVKKEFRNSFAILFDVLPQPIESGEENFGKAFSADGCNVVLAYLNKEGILTFYHSNLRHWQIFPDTHVQQHELDIQTLRTLIEAYHKTEDFVPGMLVEWKPRMRNREYPQFNQKAVVVKKLYEPSMDTKKNQESPFYREKLDLVLGFFDSDGDWLEFAFDSRRFRSVPERP